jgi:hypothetical protein
MNSILKSISLIACALILLYIPVWLYFGYKMKKSSEDGYQRQIQDFYKSNFNGRIFFSNTQKLNCTLFGDIYGNNKQSMSLQLCPCRDKEFENFISEVDSIIKVSNSFQVLLINKKGESRKLEFPFCK